ncbi:glycosyltransferase family 1 protein [Thalassovita sp.]|uniref:glycosyltransferase family 4 protein n=1 Tax=Thalassovita sp. TaxID=1979401 RepID=UPI0029DE727A|nr:glycosyltransferase family 1 protein [Thalassovita sp.]
MDNDRPPPARLLDVTRLLRRTGRQPTGVDRVELAYLRELIQPPVPLFGLARTRLGYVLLDGTGLDAFRDRVEGRIPWGTPDRLSRVQRRMEPMQRQAESDLRRLAIARCLPAGLGRMLRRHLPPGFAYLNVGHSNVTDRVLSAVKHLARGRVAVLLHDAIPLDFPDLQRPQTAPAFRNMLRRVRAYADLVICNSQQTHQDVTRHMTDWGNPPDCVVAHLGVDPVQPRQPTMPERFQWDEPFFVTVGTIEPRKNHELLLDIWQELAARPDCPQLVICGARGWLNENLFKRLDRRPPHVFEVPGLTDQEVAWLLQRSCGLLFPSIAEGYGLPPIEAAALRVPVICNDLRVYREVLGDIPVYAGIEDRYLWKNNIWGLMHPEQADGQAAMPPRFDPPTWTQHFNAVLRLT